MLVEGFIRMEKGCFEVSAPQKEQKNKKKKQEFWKVFDGQGFADWKISLAINSYDLEEDLVTFKH